MGRAYSSYTKIRSTQILTVKDAALISGRSERKIRRLIDKGLIIICQGPILIYAADLKQALKEEDSKSKQPATKQDEFYCRKCKKVHKVDIASIKNKKTGKLYRNIEQVLLISKCPICNQKLVKLQYNSVEDKEKNGITTTPTSDTKNIHIRNDVIMAVRPTGENAKILYRFFYIYCVHFKHFSLATLEKIEKAIMHFITSSNNCDFKHVTIDTIIEYKEYLYNLSYRGSPITLSSIREYSHYTQLLFVYLMDRPGFKKQINVELIESFNLSLKEQNAVKTGKDRTIKYPTMEEILIIVNSISPSNIVKRMKRAMIALLALSGIRRASVATTRISNWDPQTSILTIEYGKNDPKNGTYIETTVAALDDQLITIFTNYYEELLSLGYQKQDPLFPKTLPRKVGNDICFVESTDLSREFMSKYNVSRIIKEVCTKAGFPDYSVHKFRHSYNRAMKQRIPQGDLIIALMRNMGHKSLNVTSFSYGQMSREEQHRIILEHFSKNPDEIPDNVDPKMWNEYLRFRKFVEFNSKKEKNNQEKK